MLAPPLCPKTHDKNKRRRAVVAALSVAILALAVGSALTTTTGKDSVTMENYSVEHVPDKIASKLPEQTDGAGLSDTGYRVRTRTLVVDAAKISENDTIEDVYAGTDEESVAKLLYQSESVASVYDFGDPDNYVAYLDVSGDAGKTNRPQDVVFAYDTTKGEMIDSILYDRETGLAYIPKLIFEQDRVKNRPENTCELQAQTLVRYDLAHTAVAYEQDKASDSEGDAPALGEISSSTSVPVTVSTDSSALNKMALVPTVGNQFSIAAVDADDAKNVSLSDIEVDINDGAVSLAGDRNGYELGDNLPSISYDEDTGVVHVFNVSPMQVMNATVTVKAAAAPASSTYAAIATAGEIIDPTDNAYKVGFYGVGNCSGWTDFSGNLARTKTIRRWGAGGSVQQFSDISIAHLSDDTCAYAISIGSCPSALGSRWTADGGRGWKANCVHAYYPNGTADPPSGGYYKVLASDWNAQTVTVNVSVIVWFCLL